MGELQIIIPMSGEGARFRSQGFTVLKPFIEVHGRPMIAWVLRMLEDLEGETSFICRDLHLEKLPYLREGLGRLSPRGRILSAPLQDRRGPVVDILAVAEHIDDNRPVLVSYCDFYMHWDRRSFLGLIRDESVAGVIPCYTGFHPHLAWPRNVYASCTVNARGELLRIREKHVVSGEKFNSLHSPGLYYFRSGRLMKEAFRLALANGDEASGEYYVSLPFNHLVARGERVLCPPLVEHFCQWGTPEDLREYEVWMRTLTRKKEAAC
jgi:NDP-sugar pyrophosphorylase family protein